MASRQRTSATVQRLPLTQARVHLGAVVKQVRLNKEYIILEKDGIPVAGLMDIDEFEDYLELRDPNVGRQIRKSYEDYRVGKSRPAADLLRELTRAKPARPKARRR